MKHFSSFLVFSLSLLTLFAGCSKKDDAPKIAFTLSESSLQVSSLGQSRTISITTKGSWSASTDQTWLEVNPSTGTDNGNFDVIVYSNSSTTSRSGKVYVVSNGEQRVIAVQQEGTGSGNPGGGGSGNTTLSVSPSTMSFGTGASYKAVDINTTGSWTISENTSWITIDNPRSGTGNGRTWVNVDQNTSSSSRTATVTVTAGNQSRTITVEQAGSSSGGGGGGGTTPTLSLSNNFLSFSSYTGSGSVSVTSNGSWTVSNYYSWISVSRSSGTGNGSIMITAYSNPSTLGRTATVNVIQGSVVRSIYINQAGK